MTGAMTGCEVTVAVAGVVAQVVLPERSWAAALRERYAAFPGDAPAAWRITVERDPRQPYEDPGWARHDGERTVFHIYGYRGEIDLASRTAWVTAPSRSRMASAFERIFAYILMQALPREHGALLLHACGVALDGRGHAFFGPSGAGKTTIARLAAGHAEVLCDENVVLRPTGGRVELLSTPLWGWSTPPELVCRVNRAVPLARLYRLTHGPAFEIERLSAGQAVAALLDTQKVATERLASAAVWLAAAAAIVEAVPVYTLRFPPTAELWSFLLRHEGASIV